MATVSLCPAGTYDYIVYDSNSSLKMMFWMNPNYTNVTTTHEMPKHQLETMVRKMLPFAAVRHLQWVSPHVLLLDIPGGSKYIGPSWMQARTPSEFLEFFYTQL
jgi:hypothetical protein